MSTSHGSLKRVWYLSGDVAIERLGGIIPAHVNYPKKPRKDSKSHANGVRAHNEELRYNEIRRLLQGMRYRVDGRTSYLDLLRMGASIVCYPAWGLEHCRLTARQWFTFYKSVKLKWTRS